MEINHSERSHSLLGGSSASRWSNCTGSIALAEGLPKKMAGAAAELGTRAHEELDSYLTAFLSHKINGEGPEAYEFKDKDPQIQELVQQTVEEMWKKVLGESITDKSYGIETKFVLNKSLDMYGSVDFWAIYIDDKGKKCGVIFDFKYGFHSVSVDKNAQLAYYACALQETLKQKGKSLDYIRGIIYQPRVHGEDPYKETKFTAKQLETWQEKFISAGNNILVHKKFTFKAGPWCQFCEAQSICPTYKKSLTKTMSLKILDDDLHLEMFPKPETISDIEISKIVLNGDRIKKFIDSVKTYAIHRNLEGKNIPGTKCVLSRTRRGWKEEEEVLETLSTVLNKEELDSLLVKKLKGITVTETLLAQKLGSKKEAKKLLDLVTEQSVPSVQLVSADDIRESVETTKDLLDDIKIESND